jgi:hypothetical protein
MKRPKTEALRVRVEPRLKDDLEALARFQVMDLSDVVRIACVHYVRKCSPRAARMNER